MKNTTAWHGSSQKFSYSINSLTRPIYKRFKHFLQLVLTRSCRTLRAKQLSGRGLFLWMPKQTTLRDIALCQHFANWLATLRRPVNTSAHDSQFCALTRKSVPLTTATAAGVRYSKRPPECAIGVIWLSKLPLESISSPRLTRFMTCWCACLSRASDPARINTRDPSENSRLTLPPSPVVKVNVGVTACPTEPH